MRLLAALSVLLIVTACADQGVTTRPPEGSASLAVDLGGSSRVPRVAGNAGEGEGYGGVQQPSRAAPAIDHSRMDHGQMDHSQTDHNQMDHSTMDHGGMAPASGGQ